MGLFAAPFAVLPRRQLRQGIAAGEPFARLCDAEAHRLVTGLIQRADDSLCAQQGYLVLPALAPEKDADPYRFEGHKGYHSPIF